MNIKIFSTIVLSIGLIGFSYASDEEYEPTRDGSFEQLLGEVHLNNVLGDERLRFDGLGLVLRRPLYQHFQSESDKCNVCRVDDCFSLRLHQKLGLDRRSFNYLLSPDFLKAPFLSDDAKRAQVLDSTDGNCLLPLRGIQSIADSSTNMTRAEAEERQGIFVRNLTSFFPNFSAYLLDIQDAREFNPSMLFKMLAWADPQQEFRLRPIQVRCLIPVTASSEDLLNTLPNEVLVNICGYLDTRSFLNLTTTCKRFNDHVKPLEVVNRLKAIRSRILREYHLTSTPLLEPYFNPIAYLIAKHQVKVQNKLDLDVLLQAKFQVNRALIEEISGFPLTGVTCTDCAGRAAFVSLARAWEQLRSEYNLFEQDYHDGDAFHNHQFGGQVPGVVRAVVMAHLFGVNLGRDGAVPVAVIYRRGNNNAEEEGDNNGPEDCVIA